LFRYPSRTHVLRRNKDTPNEGIPVVMAIRGIVHGILGEKNINFDSANNAL